MIGLSVHARDGGEALLGDGQTACLELEERRDAHPAGRHAGLFHVALLLSERRELARALQRAGAARARVDGLSDHGTHEAVYLSDPDGNGLELAWDRAPESWPRPDSATGFAGGPAPLDVAGLLELVAGAEPVAQAAPGVRVGHVHLCVSELQPAERFFVAGLGLGVTARLPTAVFAAAGDYHHHVAANVWRGRGVPPAPPDAVGLRHWTLAVPDERELEAAAARLEAAGATVQRRADGVRSRDPSGVAVVLQVGG